MIELDLRVDNSRFSPYWDERETGIYVRATNSAKVTSSFDIIRLDLESLYRWLRSRGGNNEFAEATVALLLGHRLPKED